jgi:hypothetical protein
MLVLAIFLLSMLPYFNYSECSQDRNLGSIRKELLNTEVVIWGSKSSRIGAYRDAEVLLDWNIVERDEKGRYKKKMIGTSEIFAPYTLKGKHGTIISIELAEDASRATKKGRSTDIFGEKIDDNSIVNPYFDLIVQLYNSELVMTRGFYNYLIQYKIQPVKRSDIQKNELEKNLNTLIGKNIYKTAYSYVYPQDIDVREVTDKTSRNLNKLNNIPNLTLMKIVNAKYLDNEHVVLLKVEFLQGRIGVIISPVDRNPNDPYKDDSLLQRVARDFLLTIPKEISTAELEAIKKGSIIRGMSVDALYLSWGFPMKENNWGMGGKQLIYGDRLYVYMRNDKVVDWQALSK